MSSMFIEDIMPQITNQEDYLKYYIDESLPLFDKINTIIKKGESIQRQALINNLNSYVHDSLFSNLIQFIITDIGTWEADSINLFPKSLYNIIINNRLDNELFNNIFRHIIMNITTGAEETKSKYTLYFDKIIEFYRPTKTSYEIYNNISISIDKEFPYKLKDNIFEFILSLGVFGQSPVNRRLCCYLSSSLCRLLIKKEKNNSENNNKKSEEDNIEKMYQRLCKLIEDPEKTIEMQMVRELQYIIPLFKDKIFKDEDVIKSIKCYIKLDWDHIPQSMTIISLLNNIYVIESLQEFSDILIEKIKEIIEEKEYENNFKNDIMDCLIHCLYNNYKLIPKIVNKVFDLGIIEYYVNKVFSIETVHICIQNYDKIYFLMNNLDETYYTYNEMISENNNTNISNTNTTNITNIGTCNTNTSVNNINLALNFSQYQSKILFDELFINIFNKIYNNNETSESSSNLISITKSESNENKTKEIWDENKRIFFKFLPDILKCIFLYHKLNKQLIDSIFELFKKESIKNILNYYSKENNELEKFYVKKKNKLYKLFHFFVKNNYKKYINNLNINISNSSSNITLYNNKEFIFENNIYNKLFLLILNNIFSQMEELQKTLNNEVLLLISNTLCLLIPKLYKYYKNVVIINRNNNDINYIITNNTVKENNNDNRTYYLEKIYEEIFTKIISVVILNKCIGFFVKKEYIKIIPYLILYSYNRKKYLDFIRNEILYSDNFFMRKYSLVFFETCFQIYSFDFIKKTNIYHDINNIMKDDINIISTGVIKIIHSNIKKIIAYSSDVFQEFCEELKDIYDINIEKFNQDIKNFDKEKNIIINQILNIKESNQMEQEYQSEEINTIKDLENKLTTIENNIFHFEQNFHKKNQKKIDNIENVKSTKEITRSIFQRVSSTSTSFQALKNNINLSGISNGNNQLNHIPFNYRLPVKKKSLTDKTSNILKSLTSKNITNNKHYLPKIKDKRKGSNVSCNNGNIDSNNLNIINNINGINGNIFIIRSSNFHDNKVILNEKLIPKNKKLQPVPKTRTPSAKTLKAKNNSPISNPQGNINYNGEELGYKSKTSKKSVSNKNMNFFLKQKIKSNTISLQKDFNNLYSQGNNRIYINAAEKINTSISSSK